MAKKYIISLMAANRVGILAALTTSLTELGGDLQEVSQTVMQGFFTIIMAAEFPEHREPEVILEHIRGVCRPFGIDVCLKDPARETLQQIPEGGVDKYFLTAEGEDRPGMIRQISARLAKDGIDITDLYARRGENDTSFVMIMELAVPLGIDALVLQKDLEDLGTAVGLSASLQHEDIFIATNDPRPVRVRTRLKHAESARSSEVQ